MTLSRLVGKHTDRPGQQPQPMTPAADPVASSQFSDIRFYSTTWCGDCRRARRIFTDLSVPYTEIDIEQDSDAIALVMRLNGGMRSVPTILFPDGSVLVEPSSAELEAKLMRFTAA